MIGLRWQMFAIIAIVVVLLAAGWRWQARWNVRQDWKTILGLAVVVCALTQAVYIATAKLYGPENSIHIEVLLPAFVVGMLMKHKHIDTPTEQRVSTGISFLFMLLVGLSMPLVTGAPADTAAAASVTGSQPMMPWGTLLLHVVTVSVLSNLGKLVPLFFYRDRKVSERLALSIGMFTRGEVGAGVIFIALGYSLGGPALIISVLTLVLNLILTGGFVVWVKKLALRSYTPNRKHNTPSGKAPKILRTKNDDDFDRNYRHGPADGCRRRDRRVPPGLYRQIPRGTRRRPHGRDDLPAQRRTAFAAGLSDLPRRSDRRRVLPAYPERLRGLHLRQPVRQGNAPVGRGTVLETGIRREKIYDAHREDLERERTDEEFMAMYEQYEAFDELEEEFGEMEEEVTETLARYVDGHPELFATIVG